MVSWAKSTVDVFSMLEKFREKQYLTPGHGLSSVLMPGSPNYQGNFNIKYFIDLQSSQAGVKG